MKKEIGAELTRSVKKRYNQIVAFSSFSLLQQSGINRRQGNDTKRAGCQNGNDGETYQYGYTWQKFEEVNNITEEEMGILKNLKEVIDVWASFGWLDSEANAPAMVLDLRKIFGISNLLDTPKISYTAPYRARVKMRMWIHTCYLPGRECANCSLEILILQIGLMPKNFGIRFPILSVSCLWGRIRYRRSLRIFSGSLCSTRLRIF